MRFAMKNSIYYTILFILLPLSVEYGENRQLNNRRQEELSTQILDGFDSKPITTNTMLVNLTNVNVLDWYTTDSQLGIRWIDGDHVLVFTHGIWLTGMANDSLIGTTSGWGLDYSPGPIMDGQAAMIAQPQDSSSYRIYHIDQNSGPGDADYDDWPTQWGAPRHPDGSPKIYGDQTAYMIYNDAHPSEELKGYPESDATPIEIHETVWSQSINEQDANQADLEKILFFRYQLYNRGFNDINDVSLAMWTDLDIYDASANWGGYNSTGDFSYNYLYADWQPGFIPRACAYVLLQGPLTDQDGESGTAFGQEYSDKTNLGTTASWFIQDDSTPVGDGDIIGVFPRELEQLRNITLGFMLNGEQIIHPITGEITTYTYDGNPATGEGWVRDGWGGGGAGFVSSSASFEFPAGDSTEAIYAFVVAFGDSFSQALTDLENQVLDLRDWWENHQLGIDDESDESIPNSITLFDAYPNPFNPTTNIRFTLKTENNVLLQILDISGKTVEILANGNLRSGNHKFQWNPKNHSSGIYFVHLNTPHNSETNKIIYLK